MGIIRSQGIKNSIVTYIGIAIGFVSLTILQPLFLTTEELGLTRILLSVSCLISSFIPLGIVNVITRYFPKFKNSAKGNHGFLGFIMLFVLAGSCLAALLLYLFKDVFYQQYHQESPLFTEFYNWILPFAILLAIVSILNTYCYSLYKTFFASLINDILVRIFSIILFSLYFLKCMPLPYMITFFVGIYGVQTIILLIFMYRNQALNLKIDFEFIKANHYKEILRFAFVFALAPVANYGIKFLDGIIMGKYLPLSLVGIYAVMTYIPSFIEAPLIALEKIANPKISDAITRKDDQDLQDIYYKSCRFMMTLGGLLLIMIYTNAGYLLQLMNPEYRVGLNVIYIISLSTTFNLYTGTNNAIVYNSSNYLFGTFLLLVIMVVTLVLNEYLIPIWGIEGAAIATTMAGLLFNLIKFIFIYFKFNLQPYDFRNVKIILITLLCLGLWLLLPEWMNMYVSAMYKTVLLASVYLGLIYISKSVRISEVMK
jgi:O-antigen/teichoic acid export membrane protein